MQSLGRSPFRRDPAPSRWDYKMQRLWLTPLFRVAFRVGLPAFAVALVAGLVLMAAPARSLLDIVIEQNRRLAVLDDGKTSDAERDAIAQLTAQVRQTRDPATDIATRTLLGQPAGYWRSIDAVDPVADECGDVGDAAEHADGYGVELGIGACPLRLDLIDHIP